MFAILLAVLRYVFLIFLFLFIFGLVRWMINDLRSEARSSVLTPEQPHDKKRAEEKYGGRMIVTESPLPELIPGVSFGIGREMVIGRGSVSDVVIKDSFTSTRHARVFVKDGQYWLEDLGSTNGTYLNGVQLKKPVVLADGDGIKVGGVTFQFARWGA
ncbi:FHA domain-containing protein [Pelotomaculum propionicicum]|uniref:FHA domain-containing protein FhaB n=1 Tax=Pelotomaculum propionicicum TaxID=258475 RepID=A0A4Y7RPA6_9FIRM|nr:FHA domain-containing protein [Pelotomaculum propionicicum]TEB10569.1 FHA domain-containing protein FhaB [Pelotomaculum propionicicum]